MLRTTSSSLSKTSSKSSTGGLVTGGSSWVPPAAASWDHPAAASWDPPAAASRDPPAAGHKRRHGEISLNENASKYNSCCISSCSNSSFRVVVTVVKVEVVV